MSTYHFKCNFSQAVIESGTPICIIPTSEHIFIRSGTHQKKNFHFPWNSYMYNQDDVGFEPISFQVTALEFPFIQISPSETKRAYEFMQELLPLVILTSEDEEEIYQASKEISSISQLLIASSLSTTETEPYKAMMSWVCAMTRLEHLNMTHGNTLHTASNWYATVSNIFGLFVESLASGIPYAMSSPDGEHTTHVMKASVFNSQVVEKIKQTPTTLPGYSFNNFEDFQEQVVSRYIKDADFVETNPPSALSNPEERHFVNVNKITKMLGLLNIFNTHYSLKMLSNNRKIFIDKAVDALNDGLTPQQVFKQVFNPYLLNEYISFFAINPAPFTLSESPDDQDCASNLKTLQENIKKAQSYSPQQDLWPIQ